jgi:hypothetical protein
VRRWQAIEAARRQAEQDRQLDRARRAFAEATVADQFGERFISMSERGLVPGDGVTRQKLGSLVFEHWGVYVGAGMVCWSSTTSLTSSASSRSRSSRLASTGSLAMSMVGTAQFDLLGNNCEQFVRYCQDGVRRSEQQERVLLAAGAFLVIWFWS